MKTSSCLFTKKHFLKTNKQSELKSRKILKKFTLFLLKWPNIMTCYFRLCEPFLKHINKKRRGGECKYRTQTTKHRTKSTKAWKYNINKEEGGIFRTTQSTKHTSPTQNTRHKHITQMQRYNIDKKDRGRYRTKSQNPKDRLQKHLGMFVQYWQRRDRQIQNHTEHKRQKHTYNGDKGERGR